MEDTPRKILCSLISQQGISITHDPGKFRNLLADYLHGGFKKERNCLADSLSEDIPASLLAKKDQLAYATLSGQLSEKLIHNLGINADLAKWTVDTWAIALGVIDPHEILQQDFNLSILSNPPGARVEFNGKYAGVTPLTLKNPEQKKHTIKISNDGYDPWIHYQIITSRENLTINANLIKKTEEAGSIAIETYPSDAEIFLNSKRYGRSNKTIQNLSADYYEVRLVLPGHRDIVRQLQIQPGDHVKIRESFVPEPEKIPVNTPGRISVDSSPSRAAVYLDDQFIGNTPLATREIAPGNHSVGIRLSSYKEFRDQFHISPGEDRFIYKPLVKQKSSGLATKALVVCCAIGLIFLVLLFLPSTDPNTAEGWNAKGDDLFDKGNYQGALDAYNNAIYYNQNYAYAWISKGYALIQLERYQDALDAFNQAISIDPNNTDIQKGRGIALENLKRVQGTQNYGGYSSDSNANPKYKRGDIVGGGTGKSSYYYAVGSYNSSSDSYLYYDLPEFLTLSSQDLTFTKIGNTSYSESREQFEKKNPYLFVTGRRDIPIQ